jgi:peptidyl-prolyl cis-trans isomerase A (cyclophilin A)
MNVRLMAIALAFTGCAAPRDPDFERAVISARLKKAAPVAEDTGEEPPRAPAATSAAVAELPIKTYSSADISRILAGVEGAGTRLRMTLTTALGLIRCTLEPDLAPQAVANLVGLATAQTPWKADPNSAPSQRRFYDGLTFHRAVADFIIQTGNPTGRYNAGPGWRITRETTANTLFSEPGALAMIDDGDGSHGSQFFIAVRADKGLTKRYGAFGRCENLDIIRQIANAEKRESSDGKASVPLSPVTIERLSIERSD